MLRHLVIPTLCCHERQRQERLVVSRIQVERLVQAGLGAFEFAGRLVQRAHQEKDVRGGARRLLVALACLQRLVMATGVGQRVGFAKQFVTRRRPGYDGLGRTCMA